MNHALYIMRHAHAERGRQIADHDRPLSADGEEEIALLADWLRRKPVPPPTLILASSARRTRDTATILATAMAWDCPHLSLAELYEAYAGDLPGIISRNAARHSCILVLGHNPAMESCMHALHDRQPFSGGMDIPPATLALFSGDLSLGWDSLATEPMRLQFLIRPRELA